MNEAQAPSGRRALENKVAVVAGATRGAGRGIATLLGEAGATVYCTGRSTSENRTQPSSDAWERAFGLSSRPETIDETAKLVNEKGGKGVAVKVDHTRPDEVQALFDRVAREHGRLDVLVNDVWGGDELSEWGKPFWELSLSKGLALLDRAVSSHLVTARLAAPLMVTQRSGLIIEITDGDSLAYRGSLFYDLAKVSVIRLAFVMAEELRPHGITALALTPGFLRSEAMLDYFGVTEANWRDGGKKDPHFLGSETPSYVGRAVAALAADPEIAKKSGKVLSTWGLQPEYGFVDADGRTPSWGAHFAAHGAEAEQAQRASHARFLEGFVKTRA
jgi:NAD(P)-dependent dehydrogenase (short-subunit alcohol dehydrogenase family)